MIKNISVLGNPVQLLGINRLLGAWKWRWRIVTQDLEIASRKLAFENFRSELAWHKKGLGEFK